MFVKPQRHKVFYAFKAYFQDLTLVTEFFSREFKIAKDAFICEENREGLATLNYKSFSKSLKVSL
jgi:hypothetical protein